MDSDWVCTSCAKSCSRTAAASTFTQGQRTKRHSGSAFRARRKRIHPGIAERNHMDGMEGATLVASMTAAVLIIDDDPILGPVTVELLNALGHRASWVDTYERGFDTLRQP